MLLALLPFAGLVWFSVQALEQAADRADAAAEIESTAPEVIALASLDAHLSAENYWASAVASTRSLGIPPDLITSMIGIDMEQEFAEARELVDESLRVLGLDGVAFSVDRARDEVAHEDSTTTSIGRAYNAVTEALGYPIRAKIDTLTRLASDVPDGYDLARSNLALAVAIDVRTASSGVASTYFATRYPGAAAEDQPALDLLQFSAVYEDSTRRLELLLEPDSDAAEVWEQVRTDRRVVELFERLDDLNDVIFDPDQAFSSVFDLATLDIDAEAAAFSDSLDAVDLHLDVVDAVAAEVSATAAALGADAEEYQRTVVATTALVGVLSLLAIAIASWWIVRPLRRMADVVTAMREGELGGHVAVAGPAEVRSAGRALNEAADNLKLAEMQAAALADADLDHEVLERRPPGRLGASLQAAVRRLAASLAERAELSARLEHEATHDGLTGLTNRSAAMATLQQALARTRRAPERDLAVMYVDVDDFKQINDRFGHNAGDIVLQTIARRMVDTIREGDLACRLGGDEFLVIAEPVREAHEAIVVANRLVEAVGEPVTVDGSEIRPGISIGVALAGDTDLSADELLRDADLAVYRAKHEGRSRVELCDVELRGEIAERMSVEHALRLAIERDELVVHYQPVVDAEDDRLVSLEALVRWNRPGVGLVPPDDFVPVAERSHLIVAMDDWVLRAVVRQLADWSDHPVLGDVPAAINVSARHLAAGDLDQEVLVLLDQFGVDPRRLTIELTESALLEDLETARGQLDALRSRGVKIALDDFGTGYTSFAHLRQLPVDTIKVDKSFVHSLDVAEDRSLVELIVKTGHVLGVSVTAEGVETLEQATDLSDMGSDHLQGFRYSSPLDPASLEASLHSSSPKGES
ncbi:MAG: EAL domain-containing protein [Actinomycetota bacterium]